MQVVWQWHKWEEQNVVEQAELMDDKSNDSLLQLPLQAMTVEKKTTDDSRLILPDN